jgi:hypothetical protein
MRGVGVALPGFGQIGTPAAPAARSAGRIGRTDCFVLLKVDGAWKIPNKVYSSRPRQ